MERCVKYDAKLYFEISEKIQGPGIYISLPAMGAWGWVSGERGSAGSLSEDCQAICQALYLDPGNKAMHAVQKTRDTP